jgi:Holliday junction DNA helicase RuvA
MYSYIKGQVIQASPSVVIMETNDGVGYEILISLRTYEQINGKKSCLLFTHLKISEDAWAMYGFADELERETFRLLISVNGVGTSTARIILSSFSPGELEQIIGRGENMALQKVKGIGAKTAERIVLELKGKLKPTHYELTGEKTANRDNTKSNEALLALQNLGISKNIAENALKKVIAIEELPVEDIIKQAFKHL